METPDTKNPKLEIYFSQTDLEELMSGEEFKWTFTTDTGVDIDVLLRQERPEDVEDIEELPDTNF